MGNYPAILRSKWFLPLFALGLGVVVLGASWAGGSLGSGLISLAIMAGFGLLILLAGAARPSAACAVTAATSGSPRSTCGRPP
jgi:hypothetical protein